MSYYTVKKHETLIINDTAPQICQQVFNNNIVRITIIIMFNIIGAVPSGRQACIKWNTIITASVAAVNYCNITYNVINIKWDTAQILHTTLRPHHTWHCLLKFCIQLYGPAHHTWHCLLKFCIQLYGPAHHTWHGSLKFCIQLYGPAHHTWHGANFSIFTLSVVAFDYYEWGKIWFNCYLLYSLYCYTHFFHTK